MGNQSIPAWQKHYLINSSYYDYIPVVSTSINLVEILIKIKIDLTTQSSGQLKNRVIKHCKNTTYTRCLILLVPILGNLIVFIYDRIYPKHFLDKAKLQAKLGDLSKKLEIAKAYFEGINTPKDTSKGIKWFKSAAADNNLEAMVFLSECYIQGKGVQADMETAKKFVKEYSTSQKKAFLEKLYTGKNKPLVASLLESLTKEGHLPVVEFINGMSDTDDVHALLLLGKISAAENEKKSLKYYHKAALKGHKEAMFEIAACVKDQELILSEQDEVKTILKDCINLYQQEFLNRLFTQNGDNSALLTLLLSMAKEKNKPAIEFLNQKAGEGNSKAMMCLGEFYSKRNPEKSFLYYEQAAIQGKEPKAMEIVALAYQEGTGTKLDLSKAALSYAAAIKYGQSHCMDTLVKLAETVTDAQYFLGFLFQHGKDEDGIGVDPSDSLAYYWLNTAAEQNHYNAKIALGRLHMNENSSHYNLNQASELFYQCVINFGSSEALNLLADLAEKGNVHAINKIGNCVCEGIELEHAGVIKLLQTIADDNPEALNSIGRLKIQANDYTAAFESFTKAATMNYSPAMYNLGGMYYYGQGMEPNYEKAFDWYLKAYANGMTAGLESVLKKAETTPLFMAKMAELYKNGSDVIPKNPDAAIDLYSKMLDSNCDREIAYALGEVYLSKESNINDKNDNIILSIHYFTQAASLGFEKGETKLKELANEGSMMAKSKLESLRQS